MSTRHTIGAALCTLALAGVAACGTPIEVSAPGQADGPVLSIGVALDEPGMSWYHNGAYSGFSVQVAQYVAKVLGYASKQIVFRNVPIDERAQRLADGTVDLVVGSYGGQESDGAQVDYAGPYLDVSQGLLVRGHDDAARAVDGTGDLAGRTACIVQGSDSGQALRAQVSSVSVEERDTYQQCVSSLLAGESDAVAAPEPILYGLRDQGGGAYLDVLGDSYGIARFGGGVRAGQPKFVAQIDAALRQMVADGSWRQAADGLRSSVGYRVDMGDNPPKLAEAKQ